MSVARINMVDWRSEELFVEKTKNSVNNASIFSKY